MQNFFATCLALGILCGGFALTGDLGRLAARGMRVIEATDVPDDAAPIPVTGPGAAAPVPDALPPVVSVRRPTAPPGPDRIDVAAVERGSRIRIWLDRATEPLDMDVVDPATAAVILHRVTPQRVAIPGGALVRGQPLCVMPLGLAHAGAAATPEAIGVIAGLTLGR